MTTRAEHAAKLTAKRLKRRERYAQMMERANLSIPQLAKRLKISSQALYRIMR
jgi:transposase